MDLQPKLLRALQEQEFERPRPELLRERLRLLHPARLKRWRYLFLQAYLLLSAYGPLMEMMSECLTK